MLYSSVMPSKNGEEIPLFLDGKPMHSKYSPSAERLPVDPSVREGFFLVGGIGGGYHIASLARQLENCRIVAFEADAESLAFCLRLKGVQALSSDPRISFCLAEEVQAEVGRKYVAALHGDFHCLFQRAWQQRNEGLCRKVEEGLQTTLREVSADFSVQAHFGKIWMHNILVNLKHYGGSAPAMPGREETDRCAAVIAAGPTLDHSAALLARRRNDFFIIATDTALGPLCRRGIAPDAVVCVDAQQVSSEHFYPLASPQAGGGPLVFLDLCAAPSTVRMLQERGIPFQFFHSGHPLSVLAAAECGMMRAETGSGTVTIAAADIARQLGFRRLRLFGADFSYREGKPYAGGSYLDSRFNGRSSRLLPAEQQFALLMYRTPLRAIGPGIFTNDTLASYGKSLEAWREKYGYEKKQDELYGENAEKRKGNKNLPFDFKAFMKKNLCDTGTSDGRSAACSSNTFLALLPYVAYLRQHPDLVGDGTGKDGRTVDSGELLKAARHFARSFAR